MKSKVISVIMGGGRGTRLHPLTQERCKPAVPLAGKYRLVDIPISNCLNSGLNKIYVLSQFNTASLHRHIQESYKFDPFGGGAVDILSAEQTEKGDSWYQGTADAVRQNIHHFEANENDLILILSGDQLYRMDLARIIEQHRRIQADVTIAARAMPVDQVAGLGLMRVEDDLSIVEFVEKPTDPKVIRSLAIGASIKAKMSDPGPGEYALANMGIYVFNYNVLVDALDNPYTDFGKEVIPSLLGKVGLYSYIFDGYWEDIGTIRSFFDANLSLCEESPPFDFFDQDHPVYTRARYLPASKLSGCSIRNVIIAGGSLVKNADLERCVVGVRSMISGGTKLKEVVMMGADYFETAEEITANEEAGRPNIGIGPGSQIEHAIIDKNARIGANVRLSPKGKEEGFTYGDVKVRDGVLIVCKNGIIPDGTVI